jgi:hypothetical protein
MEGVAEKVSDLRQSGRLEMMNGSKPCGRSSGVPAPSPKRSRPRLRVSCSPSPLPSPRGPRGEEERWHGAGEFGRCGEKHHSFLTRIGTMKAPSEFVLVPRPSSSSSIFWCRDGFEDEGEGRGRGREFLAEEQFMGRAGVRGNEANSNLTRTTPGTVKLRESYGRAGAVPIRLSPEFEPDGAHQKPKAVIEN